MKTFVIAEIGLNHMGDMDQAKQLIVEAKNCGCSAAKFQTYKTDLRADKDSPIYDVLAKCELTYDQTLELKKHASETGIEFFSTPFDYDSASFLVEVVGVNQIKLASFDVTNKKFLEQIGELAKTYGVNVILSTGMANYNEVEDALRALNYINIALLHCVSSYPMKDIDANLYAISHLHHEFVNKHFLCKEIGYSDHSAGIEVPAASVLVGANIVEKHFTLSLNSGAVDNPVSADPGMMRQMVNKIKLYEQMLGSGDINMQSSEYGAQSFRRFS